jgi:mannose-6-phosphate isomerase-like protein (cupin superfamily)
MFYQEFISVNIPEFRTNYFDRQHLIFRKELRNSIVPLVMSVHDLDDLVSMRNIPSSEIRVFRENTMTEPFEYTRTFSTPDGLYARVLDPERISMILDRGMTMTIRRIERFWEPAAIAVSRLVAELGRPVWINVFITPPGSQGLLPHYDTHDVFSVQVIGTKIWQVSPQVRPKPLRNEVWALQSPERRANFLAAYPLDSEVELLEGDILYVPRGVLHQAKSTSKISVHLTIAIDNGTVKDMLDALVKTADTDWFREPIWPLGESIELPDAKDLALHLANGQNLTGARLKWDAGIAAGGDTFSGSARPFEQIVNLTSLCEDSMIVLRDGVHYRLESDGESTLLLLQRRKVRIPAMSPTAVKRFLPKTPTLVAGVDGAESIGVRLKLVDLLVQAGVLDLVQP